jgi:hypothetical protein
MVEVVKVVEMKILMVEVVKVKILIVEEVKGVVVRTVKETAERTPREIVVRILREVVVGKEIMEAPVREIVAITTAKVHLAAHPALVLVLVLVVKVHLVHHPLYSAVTGAAVLVPLGVLAGSTEMIPVTEGSPTPGQLPVVHVITAEDSDSEDLGLHGSVEQVGKLHDSRGMTDTSESSVFTETTNTAAITGESTWVVAAVTAGTEAVVE